MMHRDKKEYYSKETVVTCLVCVLLGMFLGATLFHKETVMVRQGTADTSAAMTSVNLMIDDGGGTIKTWNTVTWHEAMSVLNLMETVAAANAITLLTKKVDGDDTIESVNNIVNDQKTDMRWQYWVNNTYEPRVASKYFLKPGDLVVWKYAKEQ